MITFCFHINWLCASFPRIFLKDARAFSNSSNQNKPRERRIRLFGRLFLLLIVQFPQWRGRHTERTVSLRTTAMLFLKWNRQLYWSTLSSPYSIHLNRPTNNPRNHLRDALLGFKANSKGLTYLVCFLYCCFCGFKLFYLLISYKTCCVIYKYVLRGRCSFSLGFTSIR